MGGRKTNEEATTIVLARDNEDLNQSGGNEGEEERADVKGLERNYEGRGLQTTSVLDMLGFQFS